MMNDNDHTASSAGSPYGLDAVFGYKLGTINYVNRPALEETLKLHLKPSGQGLVLYGPTGCGKSTTLRVILDKFSIKPVIIECDHTNLQEHIISKINERLNPTSPIINTKLFRYIRIILRSLTKYGDVPETLRKQREDVIEEIGDGRSVCVIERAERLDGEARVGLELFLNDCADILSSRTADSSHPATTAIGPCVIVCLAASNPLISSSKTAFERFNSIHVPPMDREEIFKILEQGEMILNVDFTNVAKEAIADSAIGVPLACKLLAFKCLQNKGIFSRCQGRPVEIDLNSVVDVRYQLGKERIHQLNNWLKYLDDSSSIEYKILYFLAQSGHNTNLTTIYNNSGIYIKTKNNSIVRSKRLEHLISLIRRLGSEAEQYGLPGLVLKDNIVFFQVPFLMEALRFKILKDV